MDELLNRLGDYGADLEGALGRFLGDEVLYESCFATLLEDENFLELGVALTEKDYERAFECAHTLKGVTGNMGLSPLYQIICSMVEELRKKEYTQLPRFYAQIVAQRALLSGMLP